MTQSQSSQTNRLLGYPDDARLLIINADDFGRSHACNAGIAGPPDVKRFPQAMKHQCSCFAPIAHSSPYLPADQDQDPKQRQDDTRDSIDPQ
jgi:hypothetical protein